MVFVARIADLVTNLLVTALVAHYLGVNDFGTYAFVTAVVITTTSIANTGMPQILLRDFAQKPEAVCTLLGSGLVLICLLLFPSVLLVLSAGLFSSWSETVWAAVALAFSSESFVLFTGPFVSAFAASEKMKHVALASIISSVLILSAVAGVICLGLGFSYIFLPHALSNLVRLAITCVLSRRVGYWPVFKSWLPNLKYLARETLPLGVSFVFTQLLLYSNVFILTWLRDAREVALFQAPFGFVTKFQVFPTILVVGLAPIMARLAVVDISFQSLRSFYNSTLKYLFAACIPVSIAVVPMGEWLVTSIFGAEFAPAKTSLQIVIWIIVFWSLNAFSEKVLTVIGKQRLLAWSGGITFFFNLAAASFFVQRFGYIGASLSALCSFLLMFFMNYVLVSRYVKQVSLLFMAKPLIALCAVLGFTFYFSGMNAMVLVVTSFALYTGLLFALKTFSRMEFGVFLSLLGNRELGENDGRIPNTP